MALEVDGFIGFDPASQVVATGGGRTGCSSVVVAYGAPGTVYVREASLDLRPAAGRRRGVGAGGGPARGGDGAAGVWAAAR